MRQVFGISVDWFTEKLTRSSCDNIFIGNQRSYTCAIISLLYFVVCTKAGCFYFFSQAPLSPLFHILQPGPEYLLLEAWKSFLFSYRLLNSVHSFHIKQTSRLEGKYPGPLKTFQARPTVLCQPWLKGFCGWSRTKKQKTWKNKQRR
uniref:Glutamine-rich protein 2 n=1 Tax=Schistocephalus solidus TaxID=70667 RepID=A0A0X3PA07_SCHSO